MFAKTETRGQTNHVLNEEDLPCILSSNADDGDGDGSVRVTSAEIFGRQLAGHRMYRPADLLASQRIDHDSSDGIISYSFSSPGALQTTPHTRYTVWLQLSDWLTFAIGSKHTRGVTFRFLGNLNFTPSVKKYKIV